MTNGGVAGYARAGLLLAGEAATKEKSSINTLGQVNKPNQFCSQAQNPSD